MISNIDFTLVVAYCDHHGKSDRFPRTSIIALAYQEIASLRSQIVTTNYRTGITGHNL